MEQTVAKSEQRKSAQADNIRKEDKEEQQRIASVKAEYENDMQKELHTQGADTERLQNIAEQLQNIEQELLFIKDHAALIIEYQKDKRDLIDQIPTWQREYDEQKRLLNNEKESLHKETGALQSEIDKLNKSLHEAEENVRSLSGNLDAYEKIPAYDWYKPHQDIFRSENGTETEIAVQKGCIELIDELGRMETSTCSFRVACAKKLISLPDILTRTIRLSSKRNSMKIGNIYVLPMNYTTL